MEGIHSGGEIAERVSPQELFSPYGLPTNALHSDRENREGYRTRSRVDRVDTQMQ